jgi:hypothetical protein
VLSVALLVGRGVERRLREEQILTFQALLFILFPHPFHERQKLQDRNFKTETSTVTRSFDETTETPTSGAP